MIRMQGGSTQLLHPDSLTKSVEEQKRLAKSFTYDYSYWSFDERKKWPGAEEGEATQMSVYKDLVRPMNGVVLNLIVY